MTVPRFANQFPTQGNRDWVFCCEGKIPRRMIRAMHPAEGTCEVAIHGGARRKEQAGFSLRTLFFILVSSGCYYVAT
jgi:hypothetical protein